MRLTLMVLMIAWVTTDAYNVRGSEDASVDQTTRELHFRRRYPQRRKDDLTAFLVEDDNTKRTTRCTDDLVDELYDCVDVVITDTDKDADRGDYVYYIDRYTDCDDALEEIEDDLGCTSGYRRYKYYGGFRRYRYDRYRWWTRHRDDDDKKKSKKDDDDDDDDDDTHRRRWWNRHSDDDDNDDDDNDDDDHQRNRWWNRNRGDDDDGTKSKQDDNDGDDGRGYRRSEKDDDDDDPPRRYGNHTSRGQH